MFAAAIPMLSGAAATLAAPAVMVSLKALSSVEQVLSPARPLAANKNNVLARQGNSVPSAPGDEARRQRQRAGGIGSANEADADEPGYLGKVPKRVGVAGDIRKNYEAPKGKNNATSSQGVLDDILAKVPSRSDYGTGDYAKSVRPQPSAQGGFGNQSYSP